MGGGRESEKERWGKRGRKREKERVGVSGRERKRGNREREGEIGKEEGERE